MADPERERLVAVGRDRLRAALDRKNSQAHSLLQKHDIKHEHLDNQESEISPPLPIQSRSTSTDVEKSISSSSLELQQEWMMEKEKLTNLYQTASMEAASLRQQLAQMEETKNQDTKGQDSALLEQSESQKRTIQEIESDRIALKQQIAELLANNDQLLSQLDQHTGKIAKLEADLQSSLVKGHIVPQTVEKGMSTQDSQNGPGSQDAIIDKLKQDYELLVQEIESKQDDMTQLHDLLANTRLEVKNLKQQLATALTEKDNALNLVTSLESEVEEYKKLADASTRDAKLAESVEATKVENGKLKAQMEEIQNRFMQIMDEKLVLADLLETEKRKNVLIQRELQSKSNGSVHAHFHDHSHNHTHDHSHGQDHPHTDPIEELARKSLTVPAEYRTEWVRSPIGQPEDKTTLLQEKVMAFPPCRHCIETVEVIL